MPVSSIASPHPEREAEGMISIEAVPVDDDPRKWSGRQKMTILAIVSISALAPATGAFIYQPGIVSVQQDLRASTNQVSLTFSLFILVQGNFPILWATLSELYGRKLVYILSISIFTIASAVGGISKNIAMVIGMRMLQAAGSSAIPGIGAGTLADIYSPDERQTMMSVYYSSPLLGPCIGPLVGGALSHSLGWRSTFFFLSIVGGVVLVSLSLLKVTFRRERSLTYQAAKKNAIKREERKRQKQHSQSDTIETGGPFNIDPEDVKVRPIDLNPFKPIWKVLKRKNNIGVLLPSAFLFALQYTIGFTTSRTLARAPYQYNPLQVGLVLLSFGVGNMLGSTLGGRWSNYTHQYLQEKNGGAGWPEMRLRSVRPLLILLPPSILAFGWTTHYHTHIAGPVIALFFSGFSILFAYSSTLAYLVDANAGRSTAAIASNSAFRGIGGFIAAEFVFPLQDALGDGGLYSIWAGIMVALELLMLLVMCKGKSWREEAERKEKEDALRKSARWRVRNTSANARIAATTRRTHSTGVRPG